jgi:signal transduction histidine kinase
MQNAWKCDLHEITQNVCELLRLVARSKGLTLKNQLEPMTLDTYDPRIGQVILHLTCDAVRNARHNSVVSINAFTRESRIEISIAYQGNGLPHGECARLFRQGRSLHRIQSRMGLDYCMKIIGEHGGSVGVNDQPGIGSTLWFSLPRRYQPMPTLTAKVLSA